MSQATWTQRAGLASLVDAEGSIFLQRRGRCFSPVVALSNTNPDSFPMFLNLYGGALSSYHLGVEGWKPGLIWRCPVGRQEEFLNDIFPFLRIKRRQALLLLVYFNRRTRTPGVGLSPAEYERLERIWYEIKELNRRGRPLLQPGPEVVAPLVSQVYTGREPTATNKAGMARFIDGEGYIGLTKAKRRSGKYSYNPVVGVSNTDLRGLVLFSELYRGSYTKFVHNPAWKIAWEWRCFRIDQELLLWDVLPFLVLKKRQAQLLIAYYYYREKPDGAQKCEDIYQEMRWLNKKGV